MFKSDTSSGLVCSVDSQAKTSCESLNGNIGLFVIVKKKVLLHPSMQAA